MSPLRKVYLEELTRIQERIQELFDQSLLSSGYADPEGGQPGTWPPAIDLLETADAFLLFAELPGVRREDIDLSISDRRLELSGQRHLPGQGHNFLRMERSYGPFRRVFDLGVAVDADGCTAGFEHGILRVHLPKRPAVDPNARG
jgi:HSP20 family protein